MEAFVWFEIHNFTECFIKWKVFKMFVFAEKLFLSHPSSNLVVLYVGYQLLNIFIKLNEMLFFYQPCSIALLLNDFWTYLLRLENCCRQHKFVND